MSTTAIDQALAVARKELGYVAPSGGSKFGKEYGIGAGAWCAAFVSVILKKAGLQPGVDFPWHAWTPNGVAWGKARGRWFTSNPRRGDLVYFMWAGVSANGRGVPPVCHVGFVEAVNGDGSITTIEGNTSGSVGGSQYNGGTVQRKVRRSNIVGYVRPNYDGVYAGELGSRAIMPGDRGKDVGQWQAWLNANTDFTPKLDEDESNGPLTQGRTREYQASVGAEPDGIPGPETFGKAGIAYTGAGFPGGGTKPVPPSGHRYNLKITGQLDRPTILALQDFHGTNEDGTINGLGVGRGPGGTRAVGNTVHSPLVEAMQRRRGTEPDGVISRPRSQWVYAEQAALGMRGRDGFLSYPYSATVAEIQRRLNAGTY